MPPPVKAPAPAPTPAAPAVERMDAAPPPSTEASPPKATPTVTEGPHAAEIIEASEPITAANASGVLEAVAEKKPSKELVDSLLQESTKLLFELKDARILLTALASQVAHNTPLGKELRRDALSIIETIHAGKTSEHIKGKVTQLQDKIKESYPNKPKPEETQFIRFLLQFNRDHADNPVSPQELAVILSGEIDITSAMSAYVKQKGNKELSASLLKELKGDKPELTLPTTPEQVLATAGIEQSNPNIAQMKDILTSKNNVALGSILMGLMSVLMFSQMMADEGSQSGPQH